MPFCFPITKNINKEREWGSIHRRCDMKKISTYAILSAMITSFAFMLFFSCSNEKKTNNDERLKTIIDSLETENAIAKGNLQDMTNYIGILANGLDSIAHHEEMIFFTNKGREGTIIDREQLKNNLGRFEDLLNVQKQKIAQLADSLKARGANMERLSALVDHLNKQIAEKDAIIKQLRSDVEDRNLNITQLSKRINTLSESNQKLTKRVDIQENILKTQDVMLNEGYVKIGTKKSLSDAGLLTGGFLKKKKINVDGIDKDIFIKVDIRTFSEIPISSSSPKILTQMPSSSYKIEKNRNGGSTLYILDANLFWSVSNYLIIQTN